MARLKVTTEKQLKAKARRAVRAGEEAKQAPPDVPGDTESEDDVQKVPRGAGGQAKSVRRRAITKNKFSTRSKYVAKPQPTQGYEIKRLADGRYKYSKMGAGQKYEAGEQVIFAPSHGVFNRPEYDSLKAAGLTGVAANHLPKYVAQGGSRMIKRGVQRAQRGNILNRFLMKSMEGAANKYKERLAEMAEYNANKDERGNRPLMRSIEAAGVRAETKVKKIDELLGPSDYRHFREDWQPEFSAAKNRLHDLAPQATALYKRDKKDERSKRYYTNKYNRLGEGKKGQYASAAAYRTDMVKQFRARLAQRKKK